MHGDTHTEDTLPAQQVLDPDVEGTVGGKRKSRRTRKSKKSRKGKSKKNRRKTSRR